MTTSANDPSSHSLSVLLTDYERAVRELGDELLVPPRLSPGVGVWPTTAFGLAANARAHHRALLEGLEGISPRASQIHARPLVETAILLDYLAEDPEPRTWQWIVHGQEQQLKMVREWRDAVERGENPHATPEELSDIIDRKTSERDDAFGAGRRASIRHGVQDLGPLPSVHDQAKRKPELFSYYTEGFRVISAWVHVSSTLFTEDRFEAEMTLLDDALGGADREAVRALSALLLASIYADTARALSEDGLARRADAIQSKFESLKPV